MKRAVFVALVCALMAVSVTAEPARRLLDSYKPKNALCKQKPKSGSSFYGGTIKCDDWDKEELDCEWKGKINGKTTEVEIKCEYDDDGKGKAECKMDPDGANNSVKFECPATVDKGPIGCTKLNFKGYSGMEVAVADLLSGWCPYDD